MPSLPGLVPVSLPNGVMEELSTGSRHIHLLCGRKIHNFGQVWAQIPWRRSPLLHGTKHGLLAGIHAAGWLRAVARRPQPTCRIGKPRAAAVAPWPALEVKRGWLLDASCQRTLAKSAWALLLFSFWSSPRRTLVLCGLSCQLLLQLSGFGHWLAGGAHKSFVSSRSSKFCIH